MSAWCETRPSRGSRRKLRGSRLGPQRSSASSRKSEQCKQSRQEQRDLEAVLGRGAEEAQGAVDVEDVAVAHAPLDPVEQAVKLEPAKELAIPGGLLVADLGLDQHRSEQDRLRQRDVVAVDQPLGRHVVERQQPVLVAEVGEERGQRRPRARGSARRPRRSRPRRGGTRRGGPGRPRSAAAGGGSRPPR